MKLDYDKRLDSLRKRRTDDTILKAFVTESFNNVRLGKSVRYALESMTEIDKNYTYNTYVACDKVAGNIERGVSADVEFRNQGSVEMNTHIKLHSDIDLLMIIKTFETLERPQVPRNRYEGDSLNDLKELRIEAFDVLDGIYNQVDDSNAKAIKVFPTNPKRKVDVVTSNWFNSNDYVNSGRKDVLRGVEIYNRDTHSVTTDFPFLYISQVNTKDPRTSGGFKQLIRLLKTLRADSDNRGAGYKIELSSFEITSLLYDIDDNALMFPPTYQLMLLPVASAQLERLIEDHDYRSTLVSPNGKELVFTKPQKDVVELKKMKRELDDLIEDIVEELGGPQFINESIHY